MSERFDWNHPGLNWSHFHSLANLLSLRNGGQAEPSSLPDTVLDEDWDRDEDSDGDALSIDTRLAHKISDSGHGGLKRRFLDCFAEFAANKKGGTAVACSAMKEAEDSVVIWIARNEGFADADKLVFERLGKVLASLSCDGGTSCVTALFLYAKLMLLVQPINRRVSYGKRWSCIIRIGLKTAIFLTCGQASKLTTLTPGRMILAPYKIVLSLMMRYPPCGPFSLITT